MSWADKKVINVQILSKNGGECTVKGLEPDGAWKIMDSDNQTTEYVKKDGFI